MKESTFLAYRIDRANGTRKGQGTEIEKKETEIEKGKRKSKRHTDTETPSSEITPENENSGTRAGSRGKIESLWTQEWGIHSCSLSPGPLTPEKSGAGYVHVRKKQQADRKQASWQGPGPGP